MAKVVVVTDSTANLPAGLVDAYDIPIIPLKVHWGDKTYLDGVTLDSKTFYRWLQQRKDLPTTSQPSVGEFIEFFRQVSERYRTKSILGVFISSKLSGTYTSALQAKQALPDLNIEILDSKLVAMPLGIPVLVAVRMAQAGASMEQVLSQLHNVMPRIKTLFAVDTLEYLHRGGRIGGAARLFGTALNLKPLLTLGDGSVQTLEKVRSRRKSLKRLIEVAEKHLAGRSPVELAVYQAEAVADAELLKSWVVERLKPQKLYTVVLTPVVGVHTGPGTLGIAYYASQSSEEEVV